MHTHTHSQKRQAVIRIRLAVYETDVGPIRQKVFRNYDYYVTGSNRNK